MGSSSYGQILRTSAITGGSAAFGMLISMVSVKASALFLGPAGVGELRLFQSALGLIGTIAGLGIGASAAREFAIAHGRGDEQRMATIDIVIRRITLVAGIAAWGLAACFAIPLSQLAFGSTEQWRTLAILGSTLLLGSITFRYQARMQGRRRIGDMARASMWTSAVSTVLAAACYWWWGVDGIAPAMMLGSLTGFVVARRYARDSAPHPGFERPPRWRESYGLARPLVALGAAMMVGTLVPQVTALGIGSMLTRELGVDSNGLYWAAWGLSGLFVNFVLGAMGADFFPRLSAASHDSEECNRLVNEQIEIGLLLATPGLLAMSVLSPLAIWVFYSEQFLGAERLVGWFCLGLLVSVIGWPAGYLYGAKGAARLFIILQAVWTTQQLVLSFIGLKMLGLPGVAMAFVAHVIAGTLIERWLVYPRFSVRWTGPTFSLIVQGLAMIVGVLMLAELLPTYLSISIGCIAIGLSVIWSIRGLQHRLGPDHGVLVLLRRVPLVSMVLPGGAGSPGSP